jgi:hypothetical protein
MMTTTAKNPEITPIPVQLSEPEFTAFIFLSGCEFYGLA